MVKIYGIKNCDTIKKTLKWMNENQVEHSFHDYRKDGLDKNWLEEALSQLGWENVVNKRGTTFRNLDQAVKDNLTGDNAAQLLIENPAMIKRPIIEADNKLLLGFKEATLKEALL